MMIMMMMVMMIMINCFLSEDLNQNGQKHSKNFLANRIKPFCGAGALRVKRYFQLGPLLEVPTIAKLRMPN